MDKKTPDTEQPDWTREKHLNLGAQLKTIKIDGETLYYYV